MDQAILNAILDSLNLTNFIIIFIGVLWGIILGALPGMGSVLAISICLPFTYTLQAHEAIALLLSVYCGSVYGGCIAAILINTPGTPQSAATCFDGFTMAKKGRPDLALGWATVASVVGGLISCVILMFTGPKLAKFALRFGPIETAALITMALICIVSVSRDNLFKGMLAGIIGLFLSFVGPDPILGEVRFTFGIFILSSGFDIIPVVVGIFALSEVMSRASEYLDSKTPMVEYTGLRFPPLKDMLLRWKVFIKSSIIGTSVGILPGTGASAAAFISYAEAKRSSPRKENMGEGEPDGIIAPEAANNAVTGGALIPTLALGLPGDAVTAVMLATLVIHGITPGVRLMADNPEAVYSAFFNLFVANFFLIFGGIIVARIFGKILKAPETLLMSAIVILCVLGTYSVRSNYFDLYVVFGMGILGFILRYFKVSLAPLIIGLVLGPQLELCVRQGLVHTRGSITAFYTYSTISCVLITVTMAILIIPVLTKLYKKMRSDKHA